MENNHGYWVHSAIPTNLERNSSCSRDEKSLGERERLLCDTWPSRGSGPFEIDRKVRCSDPRKSLEGRENGVKPRYCTNVHNMPSCMCHFQICQVSVVNSHLTKQRSRSTNLLDDQKRTCGVFQEHGDKVSLSSSLNTLVADHLRFNNG